MRVVRVNNGEAFLSLIFGFMFYLASAADLDHALTIKRRNVGRMPTGYVNVGNRILGGQNYTGDNPHATIDITSKFPSSDKHLACGGVLVDKDLVLSAAICFVDFYTETYPYEVVDIDTKSAVFHDADMFQATIGEYSTDQYDNDNQESAPGVELRHAAGYNWYLLGNDIAALKVSKNFTTLNKASQKQGYGKNIVAQPCKQENPQGQGFMLGFGTVWNAATNQEEPATYLQKMDVTIEPDPQKCADNIAQLNKQGKSNGKWTVLEDYEGLMCVYAAQKQNGNATMPGQGACTGDVGGGIYMQSGNSLCLAGIISPADICNSTVTIATKVYPYIDWLINPEKAKYGSSQLENSDWEENASFYGDTTDQGAAAQLIPWNFPILALKVSLLALSLAGLNK